MSDFHVSVSFDPKLEDLAKTMSGVEIRGLMASEINKLASKVIRYGKQLAPVDTGYMRSRINQIFTAIPNDLKAIVEARADYSIYVHEGTRYMRSRPFLKSGAEFASADFPDKISVRLEESFTKAFKTL